MMVDEDLANSTTGRKSCEAETPQQQSGGETESTAGKGQYHGADRQTGPPTRRGP